MPAISEFEHQSKPVQQKIERFQKEFDHCKKFRQPVEEKWNRLYGNYRNWDRLRTQLVHERDRDMGGVLLAAKRDWGEGLPVPTAFAAIETAVPQALSNDPRMLPIPRPDADPESVKRVQYLYTRDQALISYEIKLQNAFKSGEIFGLGAQKTSWRTEKRKVRGYDDAMYGKTEQNPSGMVAGEKEVTRFNGPMAEDLDIFDFFWTPSAKDIDTCDYIYHRTWRTWDYCVRQFKNGVWGKVDGEKVEFDLEKLKSLSAPNARGDVWQHRMKSAGLGNYASDFGELHEVWERDTCDGVCTILDGAILVQDDINPAHHNELPFQIFRPHLDGQNFVGIGMIEPIEYLINEQCEIRGNRLDAAKVALNPPVFYQEDMLEVDDIAFGPNVAVGTQISPHDAIYFPTIPDVPASSFRESEESKSDIDSTTGLSEAVRGGGSESASTATATGFELTVAAATRRIQRHTKNFEAEFLRPAARQWLSYYKQKILESVAIAIQNPEAPSGWNHIQVGPEDLAAIEDVEPEGGSTQADNEQQRQNSAVGLYNLFGQDPDVEHRKLVEHVLRAHSVGDPESWLKQLGPAEHLQEAAKMLIEGGANQDAVVQGISQLLQVAQQSSQQPAQQTSSQQPQQNGGPAPVGAAQQQETR